MSPGSKAGLGAALGQIGQGLMQVTQFNIEDMRQRNLERIRQQERGEDKAEREGARAQDQANWDKNFSHQEEQAAKDDEFRNKSLKAQERQAKEAANAAAGARADNKEFKLMEQYDNIPSRYSKRLEALDKAELEGTATPEVIQNMRLKISREISSDQAEFIRRHPSIKGYTVDDYLSGGSGGKQESPAETPAAAPAAAAAAEGKKPLPAGLMAPKEAPAVDAVGDAITATGFKEAESPAKKLMSRANADIAREGELRQQKEAQKASEQAAADFNKTTQAIKYMQSTGTVDRTEITSIAKSALSIEDLKRAGANEKLINMVVRIRANL